jgi:membrane-bound lytic murein transglycosylase MltF
MISALCGAAAIAVAPAACGDPSIELASGYRERGDLPALRERGALRVLMPRLSAEPGLPRRGHLSRLERELTAAFAESEGLEPVWVYVDDHEDLIPALLGGQGDLVAALLTATRSSYADPPRTGKRWRRSPRIIRAWCSKRRRKTWIPRRSSTACPPGSTT